MGKDHEFRKDFTPEQYAAYLKRKVKNPDAQILENKVPSNNKLESKNKTE